MTALADLEATSRRVAATRARSEKLQILADLIRRLEPAEIEPAVAFLSGSLRQGRIGLGPAVLREAARVPHRAEPALTVAEVDDAFARLAALSGAGSGAARSALVGELFGRATGPEADWLVRLVLGELRQGALEGLMEEAVARAADIPVAVIRRALMRAGDLPKIALTALTEGRGGLATFKLELFRPVLPMLAQPADELDEALERLGEAALEYKLDGARVQVHKSGDEVRVYSRLLNDVTAAVPEIVNAARLLPAREAILDGEVIALRPDGTPHPFQITMRRFGRRLDVDRVRDELPLTPSFFDVLQVDGTDLLETPARERWAALRSLAPGHIVPQIVTGDREAAEAFFDRALADGHEGLMAKDPASTYEAGARGYGWMKVKPAHTVDLVVLAVERGSGRRSEWLSNIHLGARDPATGGFVMIGKTFKGMTDAMLRWQTERFTELAVATDGWVTHVRPEQVVEIAFSDVQESSRYASGLALRFARVKRYRDDKTADQADTIETIRAILHGQIPKARPPRRG